jgi:uracil-DNA glycosylase family protein
MPTRTRPDRPGAQAWVPDGGDLAALAAAAEKCEGCELFAPATQVVFGAGPERARCVVVGEQPGDREDLEGEPFVGPAGRLLDKALVEAGIDRSATWVTNAVKHFHFEQRGKRRLHQSPEAGHITACRPWLEAELDRLQPELIVLLGAVAGRALLGPSFRVTKQRGVLMPWPEDENVQVLATLHPSAVLRADDRDAAYEGLVADLRVGAQALS